MPLNIKPWQGLAIPCFLISFIGYGSHYFVLSSDLSLGQQIWFEICITMIWISYLIAIYKEPGSPPKGYQPSNNEWRRWCRKCKNYKPERSHHCKSCKKCVLKMDHHCPWTANCVGHSNMPHFLRFLLWVDYTTVLSSYHLTLRLIRYWNDRKLPTYLISKTGLIMTIILTPMSYFVLLTVGILTLRTLYGIVFKGMTQIESWDYERLEALSNSGKLYDTLAKNYEVVFKKKIKPEKSWSSGTKLVQRLQESDDEQDFSFDEINFPYDLDIWSNSINAFGYPWSWPLPWGSSLGNGYTFPKNEYANENDEDIASLPWPPDTGNQDVNNCTGNYTTEEINSTIEDNEIVVRHRDESRRTQWTNDYGEALSDLGVDVDAELE